MYLYPGNMNSTTTKTEFYTEGNRDKQYFIDT